MRSLMDGAHVSRDAAAVLTAVNLADELLKAQEAAENLRRQLKDVSGRGVSGQGGGLAS